MDKNFEVNIITPGSEAIKLEIQSLRTRSNDGEVEFRRNHTPIILSTIPTITEIIKVDGSIEKYFTSSGVIVIKENLIKFCCDTVERPETIDLNRAIESKKRAENRLKEIKKKNIDEKRAKLSLARAIARIEAVNKYKS